MVTVMQPREKQVALFLNGTWSTHKKVLPPTKKGFFARIAHKIMHNPTNSIVEMFNNCETPHKYIYDGPGTDLLDEKSGSLVNSILGGITGQNGINSVQANLQKALDEIVRLYNQDPNVPLNIQIFGWSRGGFTAELLEQGILDLIRDKKIKVSKLHIHNIDPVPGGPDIRSSLLPSTTSKPPVDTKVSATTYYSNTGNPEPFDQSKLNYLLNTPCFSALDDDTENSKKFLLPGNHEDLSGHARAGSDPEKKAIGNLVLSHMVAEASLQGLKFNKKWKEQIYKEAKQEALQNYKPPARLKEACTRRFLSHGSHKKRYIGSKAKDVDNLEIATYLEFKNIIRLAELQDKIIRYVNFTTEEKTQIKELGNTSDKYSPEITELIKRFKTILNNYKPVDPKLIDQAWKKDKTGRTKCKIEKDLTFLRDINRNREINNLESSIHGSYKKRLKTILDKELKQYPSDSRIYKKINNENNNLLEQFDKPQAYYNEMEQTILSLEKSHIKKNEMRDNLTKFQKEFDIAKKEISYVSKKAIKKAIKELKNKIAREPNLTHENVTKKIYNLNKQLTSAKINSLKTNLHLNLTEADLEFWSKRVPKKFLGIQPGVVFKYGEVSYRIPTRVANIFNQFYPIKKDPQNRDYVDRLELPFISKEDFLNRLEGLRKEKTFSWGTRSEAASNLYTAKDLSHLKLSKS
jgi:hypothetical protein